MKRSRATKKQERENRQEADAREDERQAAAVDFRRLALDTNPPPHLMGALLGGALPPHALAELATRQNPPAASLKRLTREGQVKWDDES